MKSEIGTAKSLCHQDNTLQQLWNKEIVSQALNRDSKQQEYHEGNTEQNNVHVVLK